MEDFHGNRFEGVLEVVIDAIRISDYPLRLEHRRLGWYALPSSL